MNILKTEKNVYSKEFLEKSILESNSLKELYEKLNIFYKSRVRCKEILLNILKQFNIEELSITNIGKLTTEKVIEKYKMIHGEKYIYSLVNYVKASQKIKIICPIHGIFEQTHAIHINGSGCPTCSYRHNQEQVINNFKKVHKDKYDYSLVNYIKNDIKVKIICPVHGIFEQTPNNHKNGAGCPSCANCHSQEEFIKDVRMIHGNKYDYSLVKYMNSRSNIKIICPVHGIFEQNARNHKRGAGCKKCYNDFLSLNKEDFINKSKQIHGDKYNYSYSKYTGYNNKLTIICNKCENVFEQIAGNHIIGNGCPNCARLIPQEEIIKIFKNVHEDKYDYSLVEYKGDKEKVKIICKRCGKIFKQTPHNHKAGQKCNLCYTSGFKTNMPGILYYIRIENNGFIAYKIGITNNSVKQRFGKDIKYISILKEWYYEYGEECFQQEQKILNDFKYARWKGPNLLESGNTEIFDRDILLLDN